MQASAKPRRHSVHESITSHEAGTDLEVQHKSRDLLRQAQEVDSSVEQGRLELLLEINLSSARRGILSASISTLCRALRIPGQQEPDGHSLFNRLRKTCNVDQSDDVDRELEQDRKQHIEVEDISQRPLLTELLNRLQSRRTKSAPLPFDDYYDRFLACWREGKFVD